MDQYRQNGNEYTFKGDSLSLVMPNDSADDSEAVERARRLAKIPPKAPLTCRMIHVHNGMSRKNRRAAAKNRQRLRIEGKKANESIVTEPIKTGTMLDGFC